MFKHKVNHSHVLRYGFNQCTAETDIKRVRRGVIIQKFHKNWSALKKWIKICIKIGAWKPHYWQCIYRSSWVHELMWELCACLGVGLEALPVDNGRSGFFILILADPHLLECGQRSQDGASNPDWVFTLRRSNHLHERETHEMEIWGYFKVRVRMN